tara:strand:+ start:372 stop:551 length:180 start_codon:yes stop_codon:yes gene_type:complete
MRILLGLFFTLAFVGCTAIPPMDNPEYTFGRKCKDDGTWSFIWVHDADTELSATKEKCE